MSLVPCDHCLGEGIIFNGKKEVLCPICKGDCVIQDFGLENEETLPERFFPDDREPFDEDKYITDD